MKKIILLITTSLLPIIFIGVIILVACLIVLDFFGTNSTDGYVVENMAYAEDYKAVLNQNIQNGYVPLERILYFYLVNGNLSFQQIYNDNLDLEIKRMKPISEVCSQSTYKFLSVCSPYELRVSKQIDEYQAKPFAKPIDFSKVTITSFFMEQRIVFGTYGVHKAWDLASPEQTEINAVCDGKITTVSFPYTENVTDVNGGSGNHIVLQCNIDGTIYNVTYGHLYPGSSKVSVDDTVTKGQVIAGVGTTGYSTGNHLHYQVQLEDNTYIDGMSLIDFSDNPDVTIPPKPDYFERPGLRPNYGN